ncbi:MAG: prephenate dehydratase [Candidatus Omnitrophota bacterium]
MDLDKLRKHIDLVDEKIVDLLNKRAKFIVDVGNIKKKLGKDIYSPDREYKIFKKLAQVSKGPLTKEGMEAIYREIMSSSRVLEKPLSIAYLGPEATFSHIAALRKFGSQAKYLACNTISEVFLEVEKLDADYGVVPIENSIEGAISHTLDMFVDSDLKICAEILLDISHNLLANCPKNKIKRIYSNPQVFGQCRLWLQRNLPQVELVEVSSTTRAAEIASKQHDSSAIASLLAAKLYKLRVIAKDIEDSPHNITRFLVIGKNEVAPTGEDKTSVLFSIKDRVGALHDMLIPFKKYKINLTKIESRPSKKKAWDYYFFVDLAGHYKEKKISNALKELELKCTFLKVLGSYPVAE